MSKPATIIQTASTKVVLQLEQQKVVLSAPIPVSTTPMSNQVLASTIFTVPVATAVGDLVYLTGANTADRADNTSLTTAPARAVITSKPTTTTAVLMLLGELGGFSGMTPGAQQFLGTTGGLIESVSGLVAGNVVQNIGEAINATTLLFQPGDVFGL
jgi:hypothetical protein